MPAIEGGKFAINCIIVFSLLILIMYNHLNHIAHLNEQLTQKDNDLAQLRAANNTQVARINNLVTENADLRKNNAELIDQLRNIERKNEQLKVKLSKFKPHPHYKSYTQLVSKSRKQHRKRECKKIFDNVLELMSDISRANINVRLGSENVNFLWKRNQPNQGQGPDDEDTDDLNDTFDVEQSEIFDTDGQYVKPFLRSIIHVMDKHKISHEAYHETRMVTKGFMPPIHLIRKEKSHMSEEIDYIKHPTVCLFIKFYSRKSILINFPTISSTSIIFTQLELIQVR